MNDKYADAKRDSNGNIIVPREWFASIKGARVSISDGRISLNKQAMTELQQPEYIKAEFYKENDTLRVIKKNVFSGKQCEISEGNSGLSCSYSEITRSGETHATTWNTDPLFETMGWNRQCSYNVIGVPENTNGETSLIFDLKQAIVRKKRNSTREMPGTSNMPEEDIPIEALATSARPKNCLARAGIKTVSDLLKCSRERLLEIRAFGESSLDQIADALYKHGYEEEWRRFAFPGIPPKEVTEALEDPDSVLNLDMDAHVRYKLFRAGIRTVGQVEKLAIGDLMKINGIRVSDITVIGGVIESRT